MTASLKHGTAFVDSVNGYHLNPLTYLQSLMHAWNSGTYLGFDNGGAQLTLFPGAIAYALLAHWGLASDVAQKFYFFVEFLAIALSVTWFVDVAGSRLTVLRPVVAVAPIMYLCNLYVAENIQGGSALLWPYAALPVLLGLLVLSIQRRRPLYYGLLIGIAAFFMTGINGTLVVINLLVCVALMVFVVATDPVRLEALRAGVVTAVVGTLSAVAMNAYWILPFAYYLKTAWLPGVFSESIGLHSAAANAPDVLRLLGDPGFFGHDKVNGWYFPFAPLLQGPTIFALASRLVPLLAFAIILYKQAWREPFLRFWAILAILTVPLASGAHGGADGGVWTAGVFKYFSAHVLLFQAFRGLEKWDSVLALAYAVLCTYHAALAFELLRSRGWRHAWIAPIPIAAVVLTAIYPLISVGAFTPADLLQGGIPNYWSNAGRKFQFQPGERVAMFPEQYLPQYFWGNVGADYANLALGHSVTYSTAHGSGAPSEDAAFALEAMFRTVYSGSGEASPLLRRLAVSDIVEQGDAQYAPDDMASGPVSQLETLRSTDGLFQKSTSGDLTDFHLSHTLPMLQLASPLVVPFRGGKLLELFRVLRPDETAVSTGDYRGVPRLPLIEDPDNGDLAAASATPALALAHMARNSIRFRLPEDENVRVFIRRSLTEGRARADKLFLDGMSVPMTDVGFDWRTIAVTRLFAGTHVISQPAPTRLAYDVKVVDDNWFHAIKSRIAAGMKTGFFLNVDRRRTLDLSAAGMYTVRALGASESEAGYAFPLRFSNYSVAAGRIACRQIPITLGGAAMLSDVKPPSSWYFDPQLQRYTQNGMIPLALFGGAATVTMYNPFGEKAPVHIRGVFAPLGASRTVSLQAPNGLVVDRRYTLALRANLQLANLSRGVLPPDNYLTLTSKVSPIDYRLSVPHGWSSAVLQSNDEDGLPRADDPFGGLVTFAALQGLNAYGCGAAQLAYPRNAVDQSSLSLVSSDADPAPSSVATIKIPNIALSSIPVLSVRVSQSGDVGLTAIMHYRNARGYEFTAGIPFTTQESGASAVLVPRGSDVSGRALITAVDIVASLRSGKDAIISDPRLTLSRARIVRLGALAARGDVNRGEASLLLPHIADPQRKSVVLQISNPNSTERDVYVDSGRRGLYVGRAAELDVLSTGRVSDLYAEVALRAPSGLTYSLQDGWRRRIRIFANGKELQPARSARPLPGQFLLGGGRIAAIVPISAVAQLHDWRAVYIPPQWIVTSPYVAGATEFRLPAADGLTTLEGTLQPLSGLLKAHALSRVSTVDPANAPLWMDGAFIEDVGAITSSRAPALMLDGRRVEMKKSPYGWYESHVALSRGNHVFTDGNKKPITALLLPSPTADAAPPAAIGSSWSGTFFASLQPAKSSAVRAIILRQMYSPGWTAHAKGHSLQHFVADGYANGFIVPPASGTVDILYWPERLLWASRWVSAITLFVGIIAISLLAFGEMLRSREVTYTDA